MGSLWLNTLKQFQHFAHKPVHLFLSPLLYLWLSEHRCLDLISNTLFCLKPVVTLILLSSEASPNKAAQNLIWNEYFENKRFLTLRMANFPPLWRLTERWSILWWVYIKLSPNWIQHIYGDDNTQSFYDQEKIWCLFGWIWSQDELLTDKSQDVFVTYHIIIESKTSKTFGIF